MSHKPGTIPIKKFREIELVLLFYADFRSDLPSDEGIELISNELKVAKRHVQEAINQVKEIHSYLAEIDALICKVSTSYDLRRINYVERAILRLAVFELHMGKKLDPAIVIAEAKRLARKFSTDGAAAFCQALIDATIKKIS